MAVIAAGRSTWRLDAVGGLELAAVDVLPAPARLGDEAGHGSPGSGIGVVEPP